MAKYKIIKGVTIIEAGEENIQDLYYHDFSYIHFDKTPCNVSKVKKKRFYCVYCVLYIHGVQFKNIHNIASRTTVCPFAFLTFLISLSLGLR